MRRFGVLRGGGTGHEVNNHPFRRLLLKINNRASRQVRHHRHAIPHGEVKRVAVDSHTARPSDDAWQRTGRQALRSGRTHHSGHHSGGGDFADSVVAVIRHIDIAGAVGSDAVRPIKATTLSAKSPPPEW